VASNVRCWKNYFQLARNFLSLYFLLDQADWAWACGQYNLELNNISDRLSRLGVVILIAGVVPSVLRVGGGSSHQLPSVSPFGASSRKGRITSG
jgi:hypothetical protein